MKEIDYELLGKRREKVLRLRAGNEEEQHISLGYVLTIDGKQYPVMACFPVGTDADCAKSKFEYLINGQKSQWYCRWFDQVVICCQFQTGLGKLAFI